MKHFNTITIFIMVFILSAGSAQGKTDTTKVKDNWLSLQISHGSGVFDNFKEYLALPGTVFGFSSLYSLKIGGKDKKSTYFSLGFKLQRYTSTFESRWGMEPLYIDYFAPVIQVSEKALLFSSQTGDIKLYLNASAGIFPNCILSLDAWHTELDRDDIANRWTLGLYGGLGFMCTFANEYSIGAGGQYELALSNPNGEEFSYSHLGSLYLHFGKNIGRSK